MPKNENGFTYYVDEDGNVLTPGHMPVVLTPRPRLSERINAWYRSLWPSAKPWVITALLKLRNLITKTIDKLY